MLSTVSIYRYLYYSDVPINSRETRDTNLNTHTQQEIYLMVEKNTAARFQLIFINKGHNADVMLAANRGADYGVVVVYNLLQRSYRHGCTSQVIYTTSLLL